MTKWETDLVEEDAREDDNEEAESESCQAVGLVMENSIEGYHWKTCRPVHARRLDQQVLQQSRQREADELSSEKECDPSDGSEGGLVVEIEDGEDVGCVRCAAS
jgi:hypothetical protein